MKYKIRQYLLASLVILAGPYTAASDIDQIDQRIAKPELMSATFIQSNHIEALLAPLTSTGEVYVDRLRGVAWYVREPLVSKLLITEHGIDEGTGLISASRTVAQLLRAIITGEFDGLSELFNLTAQVEADDWKLNLEPKDQTLRSRVTYIQIYGSDWINHLEILQPTGNRIVIVFEKPEILAALPSWVDKDLQIKSS